MAQTLPPDVRVMNGAANAVFVVAACVLLAALAGWLARQPQFALRQIRLEGDLSRSNVATVRANAMPRLSGSYFTLDLHRAQAAFEAVPWVRHAIVSRVWPNRLVVRLEEHRPVAVWKGDEGNDRLVNSFGEVFEANLGDVDDEDLPEFHGREADAPQILAMYRELKTRFAALDLVPVTLKLSGRGSWALELDNGNEMELGRGTQAEVLQRTDQFTRTVAQVATAQHRSWEFADLRHADGYAVRLKSPVTPGARKGAKALN
jgi:cell division protein FtsQ